MLAVELYAVSGLQRLEALLFRSNGLVALDVVRLLPILHIFLISPRQILSFLSLPTHFYS